MTASSRIRVPSDSGALKGATPPVLSYAHGTVVYLNLTNRCPTACVFCLKHLASWQYEGKNLRLPAQEPSTRESLQEVETLLTKRRFSELVFCGYGESTYRLATMTAIGAEVRRQHPEIRRRLNTIGLGSLIWGRDIAPELKRCLDAVSVSLNTADPAQWRRLHVPQSAYAERGFGAVLQFIADCARSGLDTTVTAVRLPGVDVAAVERLAHMLGARFRFRPFLRETERTGG
jgi:TatD family-associated radical SAM protein